MVEDMTNNRGIEGSNVSGPRRGRRRMYGGIAGWTVAAAAAGGLGLAAVSLLGNDLGTGAVAYAGTVPSISTTAHGTSTVQSSQQADWTAGMFSTRGGQVIARCTAGIPSVTVVPAANWSVRQDDRHGGTGAEVVLTSGGQRIEVHIGCGVGGPTFGSEDDKTPGAPATRTTTTAPPVATVDDHGRHGEAGEGHGSATAPATSTGADDHGGKGTEPGDDNGGANPAPGHGRSSTSSTSRAPSTAVSTTSQHRDGRSSSATTSRTSAGSSQKSTPEKSMSASSTSNDKAGSGRGSSGSGGGGQN